MAESATKGLGLNDTDAANRGVTEISVEGFETYSIQKYALELALVKKFAGCGTLLDMSVTKRVAFMMIKGEDAQEKALALNGTDMGGWYAIVKAARFQAARFPDDEPPSETMELCKFIIKGYSTELSEIDTKIALCKHFSSCGEIKRVALFPDEGRAYIFIEGEKSVAKALEMNGRDVGGMNLVVEVDKYVRSARSKCRTCRTTGYTPPDLKRKIKKEKEREMKVIEERMKVMKRT